MIFNNLDFVQDVCSRLPPRWALVWNEGWKYVKEADVMDDAAERGTTGDYAKALMERRRGSRLVAIVAWGGVLYRFI